MVGRRGWVGAARCISGVRGVCQTLCSERALEDGSESEKQSAWGFGRVLVGRVLEVGLGMRRGGEDGKGGG